MQSLIANRKLSQCNECLNQAQNAQKVKNATFKIDRALVYTNGARLPENATPLGHVFIPSGLFIVRSRRA